MVRWAPVWRHRSVCVCQGSLATRASCAQKQQRTSRSEFCSSAEQVGKGLTRPSTHPACQPAAPPRGGTTGASQQTSQTADKNPCGAASASAHRANWNNAIVTSNPISSDESCGTRSVSKFFQSTQTNSKTHLTELSAIMLST